MRPFIILLLSFFFITSICRQSEISGIINQYSKVTDIDYCLSKVTVDSIDPFQVDQKVLIIQMKGAILNEENNASFGEVADLANAGRYERATVDSIAGNILYLKHKLINDYSIEGKVQVVNIPSYSSALVTDTLKAMPWNGEIGGILIFDVSTTLTLDAPIDVTGAGFHGGIAVAAAENNCEWFLDIDNYFYSAGNWRGADKGEGIADFVDAKEAGRGAWSTGGGGGNDHNSGGGGGANITNGGNGGENDEPQFFGCDGTNPGLGGKKIIDAENRVFLGGGGGAGHINNSAGTDGAKGGGIIIIFARTIEGNQNVIAANGLTVPITSGADGAGGGGGGGTIIFDVVAINDIIIEVNGGDGGNVSNNNAERCMGPGGGGSGGRIIIPEMALETGEISVDRGVAGLSKNSAVCDESTNGATDGEDGIIENFILLPQGVTQIIEPAITLQPSLETLCPESDASLQIETEGTDLSYQWQVDSGNGFQDLQEGDGIEGTQTNTLNINNVEANQSGWIFRCVVSSECYSDIISETASLNLNNLPDSEFSFVVDEGEGNVEFTNLSDNANTFQWDFGDGVGSSELMNPSYEYETSGEYEVTLIIENECGQDTFTMTVIIDIISAIESFAGATIDIYPNPVSQNLNILIEDALAKELVLKLSAVDGRIIHQEKIKFSDRVEKYLDMGQLSSGIYMLQLVMNGQILTKKIVKKL